MLLVETVLNQAQNPLLGYVSPGKQRRNDYLGKRSHKVVLSPVS